MGYRNTYSHPVYRDPYKGMTETERAEANARRNAEADREYAERKARETAEMNLRARLVKMGHRPDCGAGCICG